MIRRGAVALALLMVLALVPPAGAAELAGVTMPASFRADGETLSLNGLALRTYSIFHVHIYVGGLYLPHPTHDSEAVLQDHAPRAVLLRFVHDVPAEKARAVWRRNIEEVCRRDCMPSAASLTLFLDHVRDIKTGDEVDFVFTATGLETTVNGLPAGTIHDPTLAHALLEVFIGSRALTPAVRRGLMGEN